MPAARDHSGRKFGRLTATEKIVSPGSRGKYKCVCECGTELVVDGSSLVCGNTSSCGCLKRELTISLNHERLGSKKNLPPKQDLTGLRSGRLLVLGFHSKNHHGKPLWLCQCDCGNTSTAVGSMLKTGRVLSCGCLQREVAGNLARTHGLGSSPEYSPWKAMWKRCTNENSPDYEDYKGRTPPDEWRDFTVFLRDMGPRPTMKHSIDRIKNELPYGPDNCRWATPTEQARNKSNTRKVPNERPDLLRHPPEC